MTTARWNAYFFKLCDAAASMSKDPSTKVGAVIVRPDKTTLGPAWNGFPRGCDDGPELYADRDTKLRRIVHAEMNAVVSAGCFLRPGLRWRSSEARYLMNSKVIGGETPALDTITIHMKSIPVGREMPFPHSVNPYCSIRSTVQKLNRLGLKFATTNRATDQFTIVRRFG